LAFRGKVVLGVTGSISAYKSAGVARLLVKQGCEVQIILSAGGAKFITPLTMSTVSGKPVLSEFNDPKTGAWNNHVHLAQWADLILIAPLSANTLGKLANGLCDELLHAVYLSAKCPVIGAPAMDHDMWHHPSVMRNLSKLEGDGVTIIPPEKGELASGLIGDGRLAEPENIVAFINNQFSE